MLFHGLMLIRDEADVLADCLEHLLSWCDRLHVFDTGSTDGSWEIVLDYAAKHPGRIIPFMRRAAVYEDSMRGYMFERLRDQFQPGDWVLRLDADEFFDCNPRDFVSSQIAPWESCVYLQWYYFRLTANEVDDVAAGRVAEARRLPVSARRRWFGIVRYTEPRMFRYRRSMRWPRTTSFPINSGVIAARRIPIRHYPHRDPEQMRRRVALRAAMMELRADAGSHWRVSDWRAEVVETERTDRPDVLRCKPAPDGHAFARLVEMYDDKLYRWEDGTALPDVRLTNHLPSPYRRVLDRLAYATVVPVLDLFRPKYASVDQLIWIDESTNHALAASLERAL